MFYVIVKNGSVVFGPREWNQTLFQSVLKESNIETVLDRTNDSNLAVTISDTVKIIPVVEKHVPQINQKVQQLAGPFWTFANDQAVQTYTAVDKPIELVKAEMKSAVAAARYAKEIEGTSVLVNGSSVSVPTSRDGKAVFYQQAVIATETPIQWKFGSEWKSVNRDNFIEICNAITAHVQSAFDWEAGKVAEIDSKVTHLDLNNITTEYPVPEGRGPRNPRRQR